MASVGVSDRGKPIDIAVVWAELGVSLLVKLIEYEYLLHLQTVGAPTYTETELMSCIHAHSCHMSVMFIFGVGVRSKLYSVGALQLNYM